MEVSPLDNNNKGYKRVLYGVGKRRALLLPIVFPGVREKTSSTYIGRFEEHLYTVLSSLKRPLKKLWGSFAVLYKDYQSCSVVFIKPEEIFKHLRAKALVVIRERMQELRSDIHELSYFARRIARECAEDLSKCGLYVYSKYVADVAVRDIALFVSKKDVYYCAGQIVKILKKIDADELIEKSTLIAKVTRDMDIIDVVSMRHTALNRFPLFQYAVIVDRSSKNISMLNPLSAQFFDVCDIEEFRIYNTNTVGILILVAKKVDLEMRFRCYSLFDSLVSRAYIRPVIEDELSPREVRKVLKEFMPYKCIEYPWAEKYQELCEKPWEIT